MGDLLALALIFVTFTFLSVSTALYWLEVWERGKSRTRQ